MRNAAPGGHFRLFRGLRGGGGKIGLEFSSSTLTQYSAHSGMFDQNFFSPYGESDEHESDEDRQAFMAV